MSGWVKVLNSMPSHPKIIRVGDRAAWLYLCGICYSNEHETDGFLDRFVLPIIAPGVHNPVQLASQLVNVGLWREVESGWNIPAYVEHQRTAEEIRERRVRDAARKRSARTPHGIQAESAAQEKRIEKNREEELLSERRLCVRLAEHIRKNDPKAKPRPESDAWVRDMRLLVTERGGNEDAIGEVERIIDWCQADPFWRSNILSPSKLRKQFVQLALKAGSQVRANARQLPRTSQHAERLRADLAKRFEEAA